MQPSTISFFQPSLFFQPCPISKCNHQPTINQPSLSFNHVQSISFFQPCPIYLFLLTMSNLSLSFNHVQSISFFQPCPIYLFLSTMSNLSLSFNHLSFNHVQSFYRLIYFFFPRTNNRCTWATRELNPYKSHPWVS